MNPVRGGDHGDYMLNSMKNDNHKLKNIENRDFIRSRSTSNGVNKTTNTKVGQMNNSLKLKARSLKRQLISRFQLLIIYMHKNIMINKNNKGRGEKNNSVVRRPKIGEMARKVAVAGFVVVNVLSIVLYPTAPAMAGTYTFTQTDWSG